MVVYTFNFVELCVCVCVCVCVCLFVCVHCALFVGPVMENTPIIVGHFFTCGTKCVPQFFRVYRTYEYA